jgi:hypothetical protein
MRSLNLNVSFDEIYKGTMHVKTILRSVYPEPIIVVETDTR